MNDPKLNDQAGSGLGAASGSVVDTEHREKVICPHCGKSNSDLNQNVRGYADEIESEWTCVHCDLRFTACSHTTITYSTKKHTLTTMKILIEKPELKIQSGDDGVWLHFATSDGKHASLNVHLISHSPIIHGALDKWAREYAELNPPNARISNAPGTAHNQGE